MIPMPSGLEDTDLDKLPVNGVGPMVLVRWVDSTGMGRWRGIDEVKMGKLPECETIGRIINQDAKILRVAGTRDPYGNVDDVTFIPMSNLLEITYLRAYKKGLRLAPIGSEGKEESHAS